MSDKPKTLLTADVYCVLVKTENVIALPVHACPNLHDKPFATKTKTLSVGQNFAAWTSSGQVSRVQTFWFQSTNGTVSICDALTDSLQEWQTIVIKKTALIGKTVCGLRRFQSSLPTVATLITPIQWDCTKLAQWQKGVESRLAPCRHATLMHS